MERTTNNSSTAYTISGETAKYLEVLKATANLYTLITEANAGKLAGLNLNQADREAVEDAINRPYMALINQIEDLIHQEILTRVTDALTDLDNARAETTTI